MADQEKTNQSPASGMAAGRQSRGGSSEGTRHIGDQLKDAGEEARSDVEAAAGEARSFAARQKDLAADQLEEVAQAVDKAAGEIESPMVAGYARDLAHGIRSMSSGVKERSLDDMVAAASDFGRRQPLAFLGAAALAGFAAGRFMKSSSDRHAHKAIAPQYGHSYGESGGVEPIPPEGAGYYGEAH